MADEIIPGDVRDFILKSIDSIAHLEALLLLRASAEPLTAAVAASRLYSDEPTALAVLSQLAEAGFLQADAEGRFAYGPENADSARLIDRLAEVYATHLIPVTSLIHSKPTRIQAFANAFKFRRDT